MNSILQIPQELKDSYIQRRFSELEMIKNNLNDPDFDFVKKVGHQIKGNADTFEFPLLTQWGRHFESSALEKNKEQLATALYGFEKQLVIYSQTSATNNHSVNG